MTSQDIDWDKLDEMKKKSKVINNDFDKLKKLKELKNELETINKSTQYVKKRKQNRRNYE